MTDEEKILYVKSKINSGEYTLLPEDIAIGPVYKIIYNGNLESDGFEVGFLYLPSGSLIKEHEHQKDAERYRLIYGELKVKGRCVTENICHQGTSSHNIDKCSCDTLVETCKVGTFYLDGLKTSITSQFFDYFIENDIKNSSSKRKLK